MNTCLQRLSLFLLLVLVSSAVAQGKTTHDVRFDSETMVNGTLVKAGTYDVSYDDKSGVLKVLKDGKAVASAPVHLEALPREEHQTKIHFLNNELVSITFAGEKQAVVLNSPTAQNGS